MTPGHELVEGIAAFLLDLLDGALQVVALGLVPAQLGGDVPDGALGPLDVVDDGLVALAALGVTGALVLAAGAAVEVEVVLEPVQLLGRLLDGSLDLLELLLRGAEPVRELVVELLAGLDPVAHEAVPLLDGASDAVLDVAVLAGDGLVENALHLALLLGEVDVAGEVLPGTAEHGVGVVPDHGLERAFGPAFSGVVVAGDVVDLARGDVSGVLAG